MGQNQRSQITMTPEEIDVFIEQSRTATMATVGPNGAPHLVAMWYAWLDGTVWFETKAKAQKVVNLRRNDRLSVMIEDGRTYDQLRGVALEGRGIVIEDPDEIWRMGVNVFERYNGPYSEEMKPFVEIMLQKRVAVKLEIERIRTWDHRKLGMAPMDLAGTTAPYIDGAG
ncbi:MAG: PPOX class F420-dependent oxidoreductase [Acidimicrobiales bacterium]|nr:PPOX class F420-dependent oxidoreductase [Acidimicrobiales bacterium]